MRKLATLGMATVLALGPLGSTASARRCSGVTAPDHVEVEGTRLQLNGMGIREASIFQVNVYVAALYLENRTDDAEVVASSEQKKVLHLYFVRNVTRQDIVNAYEEGFRINAGTEQLGLQREIEQLSSWMKDLGAGESMIYTYVPGRGLTVEVDDEIMGTIENPAFARAFFRLFVGREPPNTGLKAGLLGGRCR